MRQMLASLFVVWTFIGGSLWAEEASSSDPPPTEVEEEGSFDYSVSRQYFKMFLTLGAILALLVFTVWTFSKISKQRMALGNSSNVIKIIERRALNQKTAIYVLEILGRGVVVAFSPAGAHTLTEFPLGTDLEALSDKSRVQSPRSSFTEILKSVVKAKPKAMPSSD